MFTTKKLRIKVIFLFTFLIIANLPSHSLAGGFLYELFLRPDPDLEVSDLKDIKNFVKPQLPISTKQDAIKLALSNKDIQTQIFNSEMFDSLDESAESQVTWLSYATNKNGYWTIHLRSSSSVPLLECYFTVDNQGNPTNLEPVGSKKTSTKLQQGCKYHANM